MSYQFYIEVPIYDSVTAANIQAYGCPAFEKAIRQVLIANGVNAATAYPTASSANGCSVVSASPRTAPTRVFYKAYLVLTPTQWARMKHPTLGFPTAAFISAARVMCDSILHFTEAGASSTLIDSTYNSASLPALSSTIPGNACRLDLITPARRQNRRRLA